MSCPGRAVEDGVSTCPGFTKFTPLLPICIHSKWRTKTGARSILVSKSKHICKLCPGVWMSNSFAHVSTCIGTYGIGIGIQRGGGFCAENHVFRKVLVWLHNTYRKFRWKIQSYHPYSHP